MTMTIEAQTHGLLTALAALEPDARRSRGVRARCVVQFDRRRQRSQRREAIGRVLRRQAAPVVAATACALYAAALIETAVRVLTT